MTKPLITVVFQTYNRPHLFPEGLRSIQRQTFENFRVLVLDNGSVPAISLPPEIAADPRFELIRNEDNSHGRIVNYDLARCIDTLYLAYLFDDDRWLPDKLARQLAVLESSPEAVACFTHVQLIDPNGHALSDTDARNPFNVPGRSRGEWVRRFFLDGNCLCQPSALIRTAALQAHNPIIPYVQLPDLALWVNLLAVGHLHVLEEKLVNYAWAADGSNESAIVTEAASHRLRYEYSRIYRQFSDLPHPILREAFRLADDAAVDEIETALFNAAVACGDPAHFRFAAEFAEERFKHHYVSGDPAKAVAWGQRFRTGASQLRNEQPGESLASSEPETSRVDAAYEAWLSMREPLPTDGQFITLAEAVPTFHLVLRLVTGQEELLALTLDSLGRQVLSTWHLDVLTPLPAPDGLESLPCLSWHTLPAGQAAKPVIDALVAQRGLDWVIELPPGAQPDPLYFWHLAKAAEGTETIALFVDDDCIDANGHRHSPRFKPGVNRERLVSSDLAGPLCLRRDCWALAGGAGARDGSPWFGQMLRLLDAGHPAAIAHIPDVLISYRDAFPSDSEACLMAVLGHYERSGVAMDIGVRTAQSWAIRHPLAENTGVSVAVLSQGNLDLLTRCLTGLLEKTAYERFEVLVVLTETETDPEIERWLGTRSLRLLRTAATATHADRCNAAMEAAGHEHVVLLRETCIVVQPEWLRELLRTAQLPDVAAVSPRLLEAGTGLIESAGGVLGLNGITGTAYAHSAVHDEAGYLDLLRTARDIATLDDHGLLLRKAPWRQLGGFNGADFGNHLASADLGLKLRQAGYRLLFEPLATLVSGGMPHLAINETENAQRLLDEHAANARLLGQWDRTATVDPFWNPNFSLATELPILEATYPVPWRVIPNDKPRLFAHSLSNGQGVFRVIAPLRAARQHGLAMESIWLQHGDREPTIAELQRLAPDTAIVQHYIYDRHLSALQAWHQAPGRPFTVYTIDDLITDLDQSNPSYKNLPPNSRVRLRHALKHCDRLVSATDFLADYCSPFIGDIRVVPNCLDPEIWLPLTSRKRTSARPRVGWAGGQTHLRDLLVIKDVVERTHHELDWVFFGMCPDEIRPYLAEFHPFSRFSTYPAHLASLDLDLAVAPLAQIPFNQAKSNLRLLEYGVLGIPVVCTDIDPYRNSPACCVANDPDAWIEAIRARVHNPEAREREGLAMETWVRQHFLLTPAHLAGWLEAHLPA